MVDTYVRSYNLYAAVICSGLCLVLFGIVLVVQNIDIFSPQTQLQLVTVQSNEGDALIIKLLR